MGTETDRPLNPNKALWEKGDFTRVAEAMRGSGEALVATLGVTPDLAVLDLGCGGGTTAVPEAQLGANVLGVDIAETSSRRETRGRSASVSPTYASSGATRPT
jgi:cyclopropane fatty-acyl-phospholipid synthase-like methyltransferase